ncbi:MAG: 5-(carboxyamino)imidazole ribonucleotide mutase [Microbacteriaceae bacterium]
MTSPAASSPAPSAPTAPASTSVTPLIGLVMGSDSDWNVMEAAAAALREFDIPFEVEVLSAHRTPERMLDWGLQARARGLKVIIAGAGGAAHLPGMLASVTTLPVIGVPVPLSTLDGLDSLLSIVQMPAGVPVATVSIGGARNAALLAVRMLSISDARLATQLADFATELQDAVAVKNEALQSKIAAASAASNNASTPSSAQ